MYTIETKWNNEQFNIGNNTIENGQKSDHTEKREKKLLHSK